MFSCLGHDVDHTGRTNAFESAKLSKLALRYNDDSVIIKKKKNFFFFNINFLYFNKK